LAAALLLPTAGLGAEPHESYESPETLYAASVLANLPLSGHGWVVRAKQETAEQPVPVFDILLPERAAKAEEEAEDQENESLDLLDRTGRGLKDAGRKTGDFIKEPFD
jgi:hypothetical protein